MNSANITISTHVVSAVNPSAIFVSVQYLVAVIRVHRKSTSTIEKKNDAKGERKRETFNNPSFQQRELHVVVILVCVFFFEWLGISKSERRQRVMLRKSHHKRLVKSKHDDQLYTQELRQRTASCQLCTRQAVED